MFTLFSRDWTGFEWRFFDFLRKVIAFTSIWPCFQTEMCKYQRNPFRLIPIFHSNSWNKWWILLLFNVEPKRYRCRHLSVSIKNVVPFEIETNDVAISWPCCCLYHCTANKKKNWFNAIHWKPAKQCDRDAMHSTCWTVPNHPSASKRQLDASCNERSGTWHTRTHTQISLSLSSHSTQFKCVAQ